jgi:HAD superfamily hydrolase (TIGR01490 family)
METTSSSYNVSSSRYIAFFDLDRTILNTNSGNLLILRAYKHRLLGLNDILRGLYFATLYRLNLRDTQKIIDSLAGWLKGISEKQMSELCSELFSDYLLPRIHNEVYDEIEFHKKNGGMIVMLSSAIFPLVSLFAEHLKMNEVLCSRLQAENGVYTGQPEGKLCFREEKLKRLLETCALNQINPSSAWYYADSIADFQALSAVGFPVCINPDGKLKKIAVKRDWRILYWK